MKKRLIFLSLSLPLLFAMPASATTPTPYQATYENVITQCEQQVTAWDHQANWQIGILAALAIIGATIAALQATKRSLKVLVVILGAASTALTGINGFAFSANYKALWLAASKGQGVVDEITSTVAIIHATTDASLLPAENAQFAKEVQEFEDIRMGLANSGGASSAQAAFVFTVPSVYAQSTPTAQPPAWATNKPSSSASLYYVGKADATTPAAAQSASLADALAQAVRDICGRIPDCSTAKIQSLVNGSYSVQNTSLQYDKPANKFTYYTLISVSNVVLNLGKPVAATYQQPKWTPTDLTAQGAMGSMVIALDISGGVSSIQRDSQGPAINLLFTIPATYQGAAVAADANYVYASANSPLGCTVFRYTLSNHAKDQRLIAMRTQCRGIATDGNTLYIVTPSNQSILYSRSWTATPGSWAVNTTSTLLTLSYDGFGKRLITSSTDGKAYGVSTTDGASQLLTTGLGYAESMAASSQYIIAASGKTLLFRTRANNQGVDPPKGVGPLPGGSLVGVAVDQGGGLWVADVDKNVVVGPYLLN